MDAATRAIVGELDLDKVLQLIVDSVRGLVGSRYAALGIVDPAGRIEHFITSGISAEQRAAIGPLPRGHGLLGTIIRDGVPLRIPEISAHAESYGFPPNHPPMHSLLGVPVVIGGEPIGNFYLTEKIGARAFDEGDQELVERFAIHAGIAIQNARLHQRIQNLALVDERLRISRDLHDGIIQSIYAVSLTLEDVAELVPTDPEEAIAQVDRSIDRLHTTIRDIRSFITGLGTGLDTTLAEAIRNVVAELAPGPDLTLDLDLAAGDRVAGRLAPNATHELLQIVREALSNTIRHSGATRARVSLAVDRDRLELRVEDDGRGFDPSQRAAPGHLGLANLRDRAATAGGSLDIQAEPGMGTRIIFALPLLETDPMPA